MLKSYLIKWFNIAGLYFGYKNTVALFFDKCILYIHRT